MPPTRLTNLSTEEAQAILLEAAENMAMYVHALRSVADTLDLPTVDQGGKIRDAEKTLRHARFHADEVLSHLHTIHANESHEISEARLAVLKRVHEANPDPNANRLPSALFLIKAVRDEQEGWEKAPMPRALRTWAERALAKLKEKMMAGA